MVRLIDEPTNSNKPNEHVDLYENSRKFIADQIEAINKQMTLLQEDAQALINADNYLTGKRAVELIETNIKEEKKE